MKQVLCGVLALTLAGGSIHVPVARAAMVGTEQVLAGVEQRQAVEQARERLTAMLAREDVAAQLQHHGVDAVQARERVAALSDAEILQLNGQIEQLPAGGDVLGLAVFVFLVLLLTDILGYTDIFPFVTKTADGSRK
ncbi:MAG: PA2779 family protein [Pseudomonadota bacterium]